jgi:hypothetical protein
MSDKENDPHQFSDPFHPVVRKKDRSADKVGVTLGHPSPNSDQNSQVEQPAERLESSKSVEHPIQGIILGTSDPKGEQERARRVLNLKGDQEKPKNKKPEKP